MSCLAWGHFVEAGGEGLGREALTLWPALASVCWAVPAPTSSVSLNYGASDSDDEHCALTSGRGYCFIYRYWLVENGSGVIC